MRVRRQRLVRVLNETTDRMNWRTFRRVWYVGLQLRRNYRRRRMITVGRQTRKTRFPFVNGVRFRMERRVRRGRWSANALNYRHNLFGAAKCGFVLRMNANKELCWDNDARLFDLHRNNLRDGSVIVVINVGNGVRRKWRLVRQAVKPVGNVLLTAQIERLIPAGRNDVRFARNVIQNRHDRVTTRKTHHQIQTT
jgi:hypothetical protein